MKDISDTFTGELPGIEPLKAKCGRKPIGSRAMTDAERKRRQREKERAKRQQTPEAQGGDSH